MLSSKLNKNMQGDKITLTINTDNTNYSLSGFMGYKKSGWCVVYVKVTCNVRQESVDYKAAASGLPSADATIIVPYFSGLLAYVDANGNLILRLGTAGNTYDVCLMYPCK